MRGALGSLTWREPSGGRGGGLVGAYHQLYAIDTGTGAATLIGGDYTTSAACDGIFGMADGSALVPTLPGSWGDIKLRFATTP